MFEALKYRGKDPKLEICCWNDSIGKISSSVFQDAEFKPSSMNPVVYHMHGHLTIPPSLVLTEDDYLEFLVRFSSEKRELFMPSEIRNSFAITTLLFIGYGLADWNSRVLFRSIVELMGVGMKSIAVQLAPPAADSS